MKRGHIEFEFQADGRDVVLSFRSESARGTLRVSRPGLRALAALADRAAARGFPDDPDDYEARCEVRGEVIT